MRGGDMGMVRATRVAVIRLAALNHGACVSICGVKVCDVLVFGRWRADCESRSQLWLELVGKRTRQMVGRSTGNLPSYITDAPSVQARVTAATNYWARKQWWSMPPRRHLDSIFRLRHLRRHALLRLLPVDAARWRRWTCQCNGCCCCPCCVCCCPWCPCCPFCYYPCCCS